MASNAGFVALPAEGTTEDHESSTRSALTPSACIWEKTFAWSWLSRRVEPASKYVVWLCEAAAPAGRASTAARRPARRGNVSGAESGHGRLRHLSAEKVAVAIGSRP